MDFRIGYFKRSVKIWINNDQDSKEACETLEKVGKLTLWCIGIEKCDSKRGRSSGRSSTCSSDLNAAVTGMANSIITALSPQVPVCPSGSGINSNSPMQ